MRNTYLDLVKQTFDWPVQHFSLSKNKLNFHNIELNRIIEKYGTPLKVTYLPKIGQQINNAKSYFQNAMQKYNYNANYIYCYCTKSSHFSFIVNEILKHNSHIETSSTYDLHLIEALFKQGKVTKDTYIICNGFKMPDYIKKIAEFINKGFKNIIPVLDNMEELEKYFPHTKKTFQTGIRIAAEEEPNFEFYTSRLGIRYNDIIPFYEKHIKNNKRVELKMLHFFINTGIKDSAYYWSELNKCVNVYTGLKKICPELDALDIGGGFPVPQSLFFDYDYQYMADEIIVNIKSVCDAENVKVPDIFTEFGSYTVAESGATFYTIMAQKQQNDSEKWYMIDGSFITALPDTWGMGHRFLLLPLNHWDKVYKRVNLGGLTCDSMDYYNSETHVNQVYLPEIPEGKKLHIGFFNTGAYQESLGGFGGIQHCLIPSATHLIIDKDEKGKHTYNIFKKKQSAESMLKTLGYLGDQEI